MGDDCCSHDHTDDAPPPVAADALVSVRGLTIEYGGRKVLTGVDLDIRRGEIVTLIGPNGAGKTTLLRAVAGLVPAASGSIVRAPGLRLGYVPQTVRFERSLPLTVRRFVSTGHADHVRDARVLAALGLAELADRPLTDISGGERQRAALARAVSRDPDLLVLDEPVQGIDVPGQIAFYRSLAQLRDQLDCAILLSSHDLHLVMAACDRVLCLNGHVCCAGKPETVVGDPSFEAMFGPGFASTLALYRHEHDHTHDAPLTGVLGLDHPKHPPAAG